MPRLIPDISENAEIILRKRYYKAGENASALLGRVADCAARAEETDENRVKWFEIFYDTMARLDFLPNSPTLINAGTPDGQLSACFVLPIEDDMSGIYDTLKHTALIHKSGGGTGFSFSRLRPKNAKVKSTNGVASGPVSFMRVFNASTDIIKQGGARRGANMAVLHISHPDIMEFISCKEADGDLTNFNISVAVTDDFMMAVRENKVFRLKDPKTGEVAGEIMARQMWDKIVERAWKNGDPGVLFIDRINQFNPTPWLGDVEATNPCGEQPLRPYESCNLGSINLAHMVTTANFSSGTTLSPRTWQNAIIDEARLEHTVRTAVRFLDNIITVNKYPLPQIDEATKATRKIGLGVMGFADMLVQLGLEYGSDASIVCAENVMSTIQRIACDESEKLGTERGVFPAAQLADDGFKRTYRNATVTTIAPTGTISTIAGAWGGIEPYFSLVTEKHVMDGTVLRDVNKYLRAALSKVMSEKDMDKVITQIGEGDTSGIPEDIRKVFVTAADVPPERHLLVQAAFQKHTDNAVSKTINLPNTATQTDINDIYTKAWELGLKGVTVYRDGCKSSQVYYNPKKKEAPENGPSEVSTASWDVPAETKPKTPTTACGLRIRKRTGCGMLYVHIYKNEEGRPIEVFADLGKAGGCPAAFTEGIGRVASLALKHGATIAEIRDELIEIKCANACGLGPGYIASCLDGVGKALHDYEDISQSVCFKTDAPVDLKGTFTDASGVVRSNDMSGISKHRKEHSQSGACPECGGTLDYVEGCRGGKCRNIACNFFTCG